jgi:hypothetical protein
MMALQYIPLCAQHHVIISSMSYRSKQIQSSVALQALEVLVTSLHNNGNVMIFGHNG